MGWHSAPHPAASSSR